MGLALSSYTFEKEGGNKIPTVGKEEFCDTRVFILNLPLPLVYVGEFCVYNR